jgi:hypothetical protein
MDSVVFGVSGSAQEGCGEASFGRSTYIYLELCVICTAQLGYMAGTKLSVEGNPRWTRVDGCTRRWFVSNGRMIIFWESLNVS